MNVIFTNILLYLCIVTLNIGTILVLTALSLVLSRKTKPTLLDKEEARFCTKFKTNVWGLNRMEIKRLFPIKFLSVFCVFIIIAILLTKQLPQNVACALYDN